MSNVYLTELEIPDYPEYWIRSDGWVHTYTRKGTTTVWLRPHINKDGYPEVTLYNDAGRKTFTVRRLMMLADSHKEGWEVGPNDRVRSWSNNKLDVNVHNLYWEKRP